MWGELHRCSLTLQNKKDKQGQGLHRKESGEDAEAGGTPEACGLTETKVCEYEGGEAKQTARNIDWNGTNNYAGLDIKFFTMYRLYPKITSK